MLLLMFAPCAACTRRRTSVNLPIDLMSELPRAERRAHGAIDQLVRIDLVNIGGDVEPALVMDAPARVIYSLKMPGTARLRTRVAVTSNGGGVASGVQIRVGVSDDRFYDELLRLRLLPAQPWTPVDVDLSRYSGPKWSVFYQPGRQTWKLILNADVMPGGAAAWAQPAIEMR
jgi:hypothetical protein